MAWIFRDFVNERNENEIREWIDSLEVKRARIKIDVRLRDLERVEQLRYPYVEKWVGESDLYEVRVVFAGVEYRLLGCYGPARHEFSLLVGATMRDDKLEPRNAVTTAKTRMPLISDRRRTCEHFEQEQKADAERSEGS
jgi:hypothetical protein